MHARMHLMPAQPLAIGDFTSFGKCKSPSSFTRHVCVCVQPGSGNVEVSSKAEKGVESLGDVPWKRFLTSKALWGLIAVHCSFGVGPLVCLSWLPSYYSDVSLSHILLALTVLHICAVQLV